jgi:hypothetical protein
MCVQLLMAAETLSACSLFGHTTQMVHRSIEFYDKDIKFVLLLSVASPSFDGRSDRPFSSIPSSRSLLEDIKAYELAAKAGLSSLSSLRTTELVVLHSQENALIAALDASENEREDRSFDDRIATFVFGVWNEFALATSTATRVLSGRAATMEVSKVADEARTTLEGLKEELLEHESLTEDLSLSQSFFTIEIRPPADSAARLYRLQGSTLCSTPSKTRRPLSSPSPSPLPSVLQP